MRTIVITGVAGYLGQRILAAIEHEGSHRVVGIDVVEPPGSPALEFHQLDVRDARIGKRFVGADAAVHLAFQHDPIRDEAKMRSINVEGTRNVLEAAAATGVGKVVYPSSATVYGAHPDNPVPLTESSPLRPNEGFAYAMHKFDTEAQMDSFAATHPDVVVTVLRAATVFGPTVENFMSRLLEAPRLTTVKGFLPPWQLLHEEDMASAVRLAVERDLPGVYNVACDGWLDARDVERLSGKKRVILPESVAFGMADRLWRSGLTLAPPGELHYVMHPWVVDNAKLRAAGWSPRHHNADTLTEALDAHRHWISMGAARMRKDSFAKGAAATLGAIGALALVRRARRGG